MNKIFKSFCIGMFVLFQFTTQSSTLSTPFFFKGEAEYISVPPFIIKQNQDSLLFKRYKEIELLFKNESYSMSLTNALELYDDLKKEDNLNLEYLTCLLIGEIFEVSKNLDKALEFYENSLSIITRLVNNKNEQKISLNFSINNQLNLTKSLLKIGGTYQKLNLKDSAVAYYSKIEEIQSLSTEIESIKASAYNNLSAIYVGDSLYNKAKIYALKAVGVRKKNNNKVSEAAALGNLASISLIQGEYEDARITYSKALNLIENDTTSLAIKYKESLYYNLAWTLFLLKDYMAYDYQEKSYLIKDNLRDKEIRRVVEEVYANHEIQMAKNEIALKKAEERKTNYYLGALMLLILVVFGVIIYNYKLRQKNLKLNFEQNELAQQSQIERLKSETQIRILNATLDGKESERKEIAETLHDSVSTLLSSASLHLQASKNKFNGSTPLEIEKSQTIITEASQKIRDLSHTLVSSVLLKFGLKYSINEMGQKYSNSQIEIETSTKNINRYHQNFEIKVNNIIQEFVNNILKHSKATYALVQVEEKNKQLFIHIEDNGCGFDKDGVVKKDGLGINQIEARIQMMKGTFQIDSIKNQGTKIRICLPIIEKEEAILL